MDKVTEAVEKAKKDWEETYGKTLDHIKAIEDYGKSSDQKNSLPRLNGLAQDGLALLSSLQFNLDLLAPQLPTDEDIQSANTTLQSWKNQIQRYVLNLSIWLLWKLSEWKDKKKKKILSFRLCLFFVLFLAFQGMKVSDSTERNIWMIGIQFSYIMSEKMKFPYWIFFCTFLSNQTQL